MPFLPRHLLVLLAAVLLAAAPLAAQDDDAAMVEEEPEIQVEQDDAEPAEMEPMDELPAEDEPAEMAPMEVLPAEDEPVEMEPMEVLPAEDEPAEMAPVEAEPMEDDAGLDDMPLQPSTRDAAAGARGAEGDQPDPELLALWEDFNHYFRIARPDLALASAQALLDRATPQQLLDVAEGSREYPKYEETLSQSQQVETLRDVSRQLGRALQVAQFERAQDPDRIMADIRRLAEGPRAQANAIARLRAAGQYAAPHLLRVLLDERERDLHPYVLDAMVVLGRPLVYPLSVALPQLEPVPQRQIAQVLAGIGYRSALPYLAQVMADPQTDPTVRRTVETAYRQIARAAGIPEGVSAAELFLALAENYYSAATAGNVPGVEEQQNRGIVWHYGRSVGLVAIPVPAEVFGDVLSMRASGQALELNPQLDPALSVWLAANLRRENRLPEGQMDASYGEEMRPPMFYAVMAGPLRQQDVLHRALRDRDAALALDAIDALDATAGTDALLNREGTVQPLLRALSYPDRRVRYGAAFALTNARPQSEFTGSARVVPVLAEAVRQGETRYAVVLGRDQDSLNQLVSAARDLDYQTYGGSSLDEVLPSVEAGAGADLIVTNQRAGDVIELYRATTATSQLAAVPIVAVVPREDVVELSRRYERDPRLRVIESSEDPGRLRDALEAASRAYVGEGMQPQEAERYAATALRLLREIALGDSRVFRVAEAQPALIQALTDERPIIATQAADVVAMLRSAEAQRAIADAALNPSRDESLRVEFLNSLAESATQWGNQLNEAQLADLLELVKTGEGDMAIAAGRAHGALTLPTANVVEMISGGRRD